MLFFVNTHIGSRAETITPVLSSHVPPIYLLYIANATNFEL